MSEAKIVISATDNTRSAFDSAKNNLQGLHTSATAVLGALGALGSVGMFASMIKGSIDAAAGLNDLSIQTGATVEALSALGSIGKLSDISLEQIGGAMNKLAKNMAGATEESKGTGQAIEALGLNFDTFKKLNPEDQMQAIAKAMDNSADGSGKAAVAMALYGKEGAKMLPFLKDLAQVGDLQAKVTAEQAAMADNFADNLTKLQTSGEAWGKELAMGILPALDLGVQAFTDITNESGGLRDEVRKLSADGSLKSWTMAAINGLTYVADAAQYVIRAIKMTGESIGAYAAAGVAYFSGIGQALKQVIAGDFTGAVASMKGGVDESKTIIAGLGDSLIASFGEDTVGSRIRARMKEIEATGVVAEKAKPQLDFTNVMEKNSKATKETGKAAQEAQKAYAELVKAAQALANIRNADIDSINAYMRAEEQGRIATVKAANDSVQAAQDEFDNYGKTKSQIAEVTLARMNDKLAAVNAGTEIAASIQQQIEAQQQLIGILQNGEVRDASVEAAKAAAGEWKKTSDDIGRGLTDSLFRAFESGKGFFKTLWNGIKNLFKTTVLKMIIQPVTGALTGALGLSGPANAATGSSDLMGMASNASSLYSATSSMVTLGSQVVAGTMSVANALGTVAANATGTGISGLLATNGAYGTAAAGSASASAGSFAAAAGGFAAAAGSVLAGVALGSLIAGDKVVLGMSGTATSAIGAAIGLAVAGPIGAVVGGVLGGLTNAAFGMGAKKSTAEGITGTLSATGGADVQNFSDWKQKGGWFRSNKSGTEYGAVNDDVKKYLDYSVVAITSTTKAYAEAIGLSAGAVANYSQKIRVDLKGLDAAGSKKAVDDALVSFSNGMAGVYAGLTGLAKDGETAGVTLARLATGLTVVNAQFGFMGAALLDASLAGAAAAGSLLDALGGMESANAKIGAYYANFYSQSEQAANSTRALTGALAALGYALPESRAGFRALVEAQDLATASGRSAYAALLSVQEAFATLAPSAEVLADALAAQQAEQSAKQVQAQKELVQRQKELATAMLGSADGLRAAMRSTRLGQLSGGQGLVQQQGQFAQNYSMALATTGAVQAGYADQLAAALPDLSAALMDAAGTRSEWALATAKLMAQSDAVASLLEMGAPKDYAADSLAMLGQIDAAVTAGSAQTTAGLHAVIAALTGSPVPAFAAGGSFAGGLRIVGENGPELEATGPSRIFSAGQTRSMLSGSGNAELIAEIRALRSEVEGLRSEARATASHSAKTARILTRVTRDGEALQTVAAA